MGREWPSPERWRTLGQLAVIGIPFAWLAALFLFPFLIVLKISLAEALLAQPPYTALARWADGPTLELRLSLANYELLWADPLYREAFASSLKVAALSTGACLLLGYPMAYAIATAEERWRTVLLMLVILPFWTSFLIRIYAWTGLLNTHGLLNNLLMGVGLTDAPLAILHTPLAVYIGMIYGYLPFMILPLYAVLVRLDHVLLEAAADLGCHPFRAFLSITLPLSAPGIVAGCMLVFIPAMGEFVIPDLLGGPQTLMLGKLLWTEFFSNRDWPLASALALVVLALLVIPFVILQRWQRFAEGRDA